MARKRTPNREAIGSAIAYEIDWHALGFIQVVRCGGTVELTTSTGHTYKIQVSS